MSLSLDLIKGGILPFFFPETLSFAFLKCSKLCPICNGVFAHSITLCIGLPRPVPVLVPKVLHLGNSLRHRETLLMWNFLQFIQLLFVLLQLKYQQSRVFSPHLEVNPSIICFDNTSAS